MKDVFEQMEGKRNSPNLVVRARTARMWLHRLGIHYKRLGKGVYVDGHEREDVVEYRQQVFVPKWLELRKRFCIFDPSDEASPWKIPPGLGHEKGIVLVTHDESTFNANDSSSHGWVEGDKMPLRPKGRGKGIMVSGFFTPGRLLTIPSSVSDPQILSVYPGWRRNADGSLVREAVVYLEYGKDNYWTGEKMIDHALEAACIFKFAFPNFRGLFAFDNASSHCAYAEDALIAERMNFGPGGKQPWMRDGFYVKHDRRRPQRMSFSALHENPNLANAPKGLKQVLVERGLWREHTNFGRFLLKCLDSCPTSGMDHKQCCARTVLANQPDFLSQKGKLEEELQSRGIDVIFIRSFIVRPTSSSESGARRSTTPEQTAHTRWRALGGLFRRRSIRFPPPLSIVISVDVTG